MEKPVIRFVTVRDVQELLSVYRPYVEKTAITFEYAVPTPGEFARRMQAIQTRYPYLAAVCNGKIAGYAYAGVFKDRSAYDWSVESSIYVRREDRGKGIGSALYACLESLLAAQGILNLNACIACAEKEDEYLTNQSVFFHAAHGFTEVGRFHQSGYKFDRWYDMIWMEKQLGPHTVPPRIVQKVSALSPEVIRSCGVCLPEER